jgi:CelD/BcsL family acetyltransferase involved in cellulose biosynthesis
MSSAARTTQPRSTSSEPRPLRCEIKSGFSELEAISASWTALERSPSTQVFQSFAWARAFWQAYQASFTICTPVVYDRDRVIGILPVISHGRTLRMLGYRHADYNDVLCAEADARAVLELSLRALRRLDVWDRCEFDHVPAHGMMARHIGSLAPEIQSAVQMVFRAPCPVYQTEANVGAFTRLANKKHIKRQRNRLERLGRLSFRHLEDASEVREHLPRLFQQHIQRRELLRQTSRLQNPEAQRFHFELAAELDPRGPLRFSVLELEGRALAYHLGFEFNRRFIFYTAGFDPEFLAYSPGEVLLGKLMEYAESRGLAEFDFGIGGEMYKRRFSNHVKQNLRVYVTRRRASLPVSFARQAMGALRLHKEAAEQRAYEQRRALPGSVRLLNHLLQTRDVIRGFGVSGWLAHEMENLRRHHPRRQIMPPGDVGRNA